MVAFGGGVSVSGGEGSVVCGVLFGGEARCWKGIMLARCSGEVLLKMVAKVASTLFASCAEMTGGSLVGVWLVEVSWSGVCVCVW